VKGKGDTLRSEPVKSKASNAYTAHLVADSLVPGQRYAYRIRSNGRTLKGDPTWTFSSQSLLKDLERPSSFRMALGSCAFFNDPAHDNMEDPYGQHYGIFQAIAEKNPELMLWLGDNIYLRRSDLSSQEGFYHRYSRSRRMDSLKGLLSATHHYAIWDDHDFGPNNSDRSFPFADRSLKAFRRFWMSEAYEADGFPGITGSFRYQDIEVFLLDDRWFRTPQDKKSGTRQLLGEAQIEWLIEGLLTSKAPFKLVAMGGQVLNPAAVYETYAQFPEERKRLLERIQEEGIEGVIFLTGDRHHSELSKWEPDTGLTVYDLTVSPLTSSPADNRDEANEWRVEGTYVAKNNFAVLRIHGPLEDRKLSIKVFDHRGELLWERGIEAP
jgi:alkaline phosphatase D